MNAVIGIDLDNTLACYDDLFHRVACEEGLIGPETAASKEKIRDAIRSLPDGESRWTRLQAIVYGPRMSGAPLFDGVSQFLRRCAAARVPVCIVSHKVQLVALDGGLVDMRAAALAWLRANGFFSDFSLSPRDVYFESTRLEKIARIRALGCTHFIDDLAEVFGEDAFPREIAKLLFAPHGAACVPQGVCVFDDWRAIDRHFFPAMTDSAVQTNIRETLLHRLNKEVRAIRQLKGGRNSRVFRVDCDDGTAVAVKAYFQSVHDRRDRMGCEFRALGFLKEKGLREVAAPLAADEARGVAVYEFVEGGPLRDEDVGMAEIDCAVGFLRRLKNIADQGDAAHFPAASDACFSIEEILRDVDGRIQRLMAASAHEAALADFLQKELLPFRRRAEEWSRAFCHENGIPPGAEIPMGARTLSPSDFGFHNALRRKDGSLVFLDFEYFGWDDPAKTVVDFLLHPGMKLPCAPRQRFFEGMIAAFAGVPGLADRVRAVYPLFGLKWCGILLNEFTLEHLARRRFADGTQDAWNQGVQLEKARLMLARITNDLGDFPYHP